MYNFSFLGYIFLQQQQQVGAIMKKGFPCVVCVCLCRQCDFFEHGRVKLQKIKLVFYLFPPILCNLPSDGPCKCVHTNGNQNDPAVIYSIFGIDTFAVDLINLLSKKEEEIGTGGRRSDPTHIYNIIQYVNTKKTHEKKE